MAYITDIRKQTITVDKKTYSREDILNSETLPFANDLSSFLKEWFNDSPHILVQTSGSTGTSKKMLVEKSRMLQSARFTCSFLGLKTRDSALLCMNLKYIGAKMVVIRSLLAGLNLIQVEASGYPLKDTEATDFAAMTPLQVYNSLQDPEQKEKLRQIRHLIIGGGTIDSQLAKELANFPNTVWSTYGMTETLSHIALRPINGEKASEWYIPFKGVTVSLSEEQTLIISAPLVTKEVLKTNDIAEINKKGHFRILGRRDNIINSGGVKIQIEEVESLLKSGIFTNFIITSAPDPKFGEIVILLVKEGEYTISELKSISQSSLPIYWQPKHIFLIKSIPHTETNKPDRGRAKEIAKEMIYSLNLYI